MRTDFTWSFPLPRTHTGMLLGNGTLGAMVWGEGSVLRLTIGRADFWDHRGGMPWTEGMSYAKIRALLEAKDEAGLRTLFERTAPAAGEPHQPSLLPIGRLELDFGAGVELTQGKLDWRTGEVEVTLVRGGVTHTVGVLMDMTHPLLALRLPPACLPQVIRKVPAWKYVGEHLASISFSEPEPLPPGALHGWIQRRPVDPPLCIAWRQQGGAVYLTAGYGKDPADATAVAAALLRQAGRNGYAVLHQHAHNWWRAYWDRVPKVEIPNDRLQFLYQYGMYKFAGLTNPSGVAATLQGPWLEEYQMPPWSSDYHFNINVQMCYWPAYHGNCLEHLLPLFKLIGTWTAQMRHNAEVFVGTSDGLMLPHAVDDRCVCMGGFWTGSVDHGCTGWVAQMMFRYYRYTMDEAFLRETAWPFMLGAARVFEAMLERDGDKLSLPVTTSPEYRGAQMNAWGRNASFQLACLHRLVEDLLEAAAVLKETPRPIWREIQAKVPKASLIEKNGRPQIALWDGTPLEESHRHHSHLAGLTPFDVIDASAPEWERVVCDSLNHWMLMGPSLWSGWCMPWAAMLHTRMGRGTATELLLEIWQRVFTNEGHGTLHDGNIPGYTLFGQTYTVGGPPRASLGSHQSGEIMQIEAGMAATAAIQEMLLHTRRGVTYIFAGAPATWDHVAFSGMRTDGAFLVSARRERGQVEEVQVECPAGGTLRLHNPWAGEAVVMRLGGQIAKVSGSLLELATTPGETLTLVAASSTPATASIRMDRG